MPTISMSLEEKVRAIIMRDDAGAGPASMVAQRPAWFDFDPTELESEMRSWGLVYGIAFGLARTEEPCEPIESVAERAYKAAWPVYVTYAGDFTKPEREAVSA